MALTSIVVPEGTARMKVSIIRAVGTSMIWPARSAPKLIGAGLTTASAGALSFSVQDLGIVRLKRQAEIGQQLRRGRVARAVQVFLQNRRIGEFAARLRQPCAEHP